MYSAGIPQVVLPVWMDTYDFALRAEILGIGYWGNRHTDKLCKGGQLGSILIEVMLGGRSSAYTKKAKELAELCNRSGGGRVFAARYILAEIERQKKPLLLNGKDHQA
jgi:UDP:flavonoid glycosyltransferase YjiC (YdhE family)